MKRYISQILFIIFFMLISNLIYAYERTVVHKHSRDSVYNACLDAFKELEKDNDGLFYFEKSKEYISVSLVTKQKSLVNINVYISVKGEHDSKVRVSVDQDEVEIKSLVDSYVDKVNKSLEPKEVKREKKVEVKKIAPQKVESVVIPKPEKPITKVNIEPIPVKVVSYNKVEKEVVELKEETLLQVSTKSVELKATLDRKVKDIRVEPKKELKDDFVALVKKSKVKPEVKELTPQEKFSIYKRRGYDFYLAKEYMSAYKNYKKALDYNDIADIQMWVIRCILKGVPQAKSEDELNLLYSELDKYSLAINVDELSTQYKSSYKYIRNDIRIVKKNKKNYYLNLKYK